MEKTASGLQYEDTQVGTGASPQRGQTCQMHYTGWLWENGAKGKKFDSSLDRGQPFAFPLGMGRVIKGWDEGVASMKVGGKRTLLIPPGLGYGDRGAGGELPGGATLLFEVELLGVGRSHAAIASLVGAAIPHSTTARGFVRHSRPSSFHSWSRTCARSESASFPAWSSSSTTCAINRSQSACTVGDTATSTGAFVTRGGGCSTGACGAGCPPPPHAASTVKTRVLIALMVACAPRCRCGLLPCSALSKASPSTSPSRRPRTCA